MDHSRTEDNTFGVSVVGLVYNQTSYIRQALDSILRQETAFPYEVVLHDDCSTDGTGEILREYAAKYPQKVKILFEGENQYSKGAQLMRKTMRYASGRYIAICEGDDYWLDRHKLQVQWDAMDAHPECDMCACWGCTVTEDGGEEISQIRPRRGNGVLSPEEVILGGGQYLVTAGLFFRRSILDAPMEFESVSDIDYAWQIRGALRGGIWYLDRKMAAYRRYAKGSWTVNVLRSMHNLKEHWKVERKLLEILDRETGGTYHSTIASRLRAYIPFTDQLAMHQEELLAELDRNRGRRFLWGLGRRGREFECFCSAQNIRLDGVCDAINDNVGEMTELGNQIYDTTEVLQNADVILASNRFAYEDLIKSGFIGQLLDLQKYMPWG